MADQSSGSESRAYWIKSNQGVAVLLTAVVGTLLVYLLSSEWVYQELRDGFKLGFFPVAAAVATLVCTVAMIFDKQRHLVDEDVAKTGWFDWAVAGVCVVACFVYFQLAWQFDFLLVSPVFLAGAMYIFGVRPIRSAITSAVIMSIFVYVLFRLIGIPLPTHIVWF
jgi:hypothetical protein